MFYIIFFNFYFTYISSKYIFATLFFVSLGMMLDPAFLVRNWAAIALTVAVIIFIKLLVVFGVVRLFGYSTRIALLTGVGLFQIGEFGFILAQGGLGLWHGGGRKQPAQA